MTSNVIAMPQRSGARRVSKKQLAAHLGVTTRTIEIRMAEGMPALPRTGPQDKVYFDIVAVEGWLAERSPKDPNLKERVGSLEKQVADLRGTVVSLAAQLDRERQAS